MTVSWLEKRAETLRAELYYFSFLFLPIPKLLIDANLEDDKINL